LRKLLLQVLSLLAVAAGVCFFLQPAFGQGGPVSSVTAQVVEIPVAAPLNAVFLNYVNSVRPLGVQNGTIDGHGLGFLPSPIDRSYLAGQSIFPIRPLAALPSSYDLRALGKVTPVKDQYSCGDCWAFATMGSIESNLLTAETWDFSENNLKNTHGFDWGPCDGGNGDMSTAYLARWDGPVNELDDPYNPDPAYTSPAALPEQKHVQEVLILPGRTDPMDNDNIKQAMMDYGGVWTSYYASGSYRCPVGPCTTTYYYSDPKSSNHAVTIVGWDDNFSKGNFSPIPPGDGAFIIKNSWGTWWGNGGYFYISYYDANLGHGANYVFNGAEPVTNYSRVYQYDPLGWTYDIGYGRNTAWFANIFTAAASEQVAAVSFYTASVGSSYEIYVYTDTTSGPRSASMGSATTGTIAIPGYHTITLPSPVSIASGQKFSVVAKLTTPGYNYPVPLEYPYPGYASGATASAGQSYISYDGSSWSDITSYYANTNVCLKAFTVPPDTTPPPAPISLSATPDTWTNVNSFSISWTSPSDPSGIAGAYYKIGSSPTSDTDGTYTTSKPFSVGAAAQGGQVIYVWLEDSAGNKSHLNRSAVTLYYDGTPPADGTLSAAPQIRQVGLSWIGFSDAVGSGLGIYRVMRNAGSYPAVQCTTGTEIYLGGGSAFADTGLADGLTYYYRACAYDNAGNVSSGSTAFATLISCGDQPVKDERSGNTYPLLQDAFDNADTLDGDTIQILATTLSDTPDFSRNISVTLRGGYDCGFGGSSGGSIIHGSLTVSAGKVTLDSVTVQ
jgi:C1A family cysteine protease